MKNDQLAKVCIYRIKTLNIRIFFIFLSTCLTFSLHPIKVGAIQLQSLDNNDFFSPSYDILGAENSNQIDMSPVDQLQLLLKSKQYGAILNKIDELTNDEKNDENIISIKAAALVGNGNFPAAQKEYYLLREKKEASSQSFSLVADMFLLKKKPFMAMMVCQSGLMRKVKSSKLLYQMGYAYSLMGKIQPSLKYFNGAESANILSPELKSQASIEKAIAVAYYKLHDFENAKKRLKNLKFVGSDSGIDLIIDAKYQVSIGNFKKAFSLLDEAQITSKSLEATLTKSQFYILDSKPSQSIALIDSLSRNFGTNNLSDVLKLTKALAYLTAGKADLSLDLLEKVEHPEKITNMHMLKAITYFSMNERMKVIEELKQTSLPYSELALLPDFANYLSDSSIGPDIALAFFCLDQKFYRQAIQIAEKATQKTKNNILLNFIIAEAYLQSEKYSLAINELVKLNEVFKGSYALQFYLSQAYAKAGMIDNAEKTYVVLTKKRPDFILANLVYGKLLSEFSRWGEARKVYENGLNFIPDSPLLQASLGWSLINLNDLNSLENLVPIMDKNNKIEPASLLHLKGWFEYKKNNYARAEELLKKALETAPGDPEICYHLGMAMLENGKKELAKNLIQQSFLFEAQKEKYQGTVDKDF